MNKDSAQTSEFGFQDFRQIMGRRKWTVAVVLGIAIMCDIVACLALPPLWRTTVRVLAQPTVQNQAYETTDPEQRVAVQAQTPQVENQVEVLSSVSLLVQAFQNAGVQVPPEALDPNSRSNPIQVKEVGISDAVDVSVDLPDQNASANVAQQIPKVFSLYLTSGQASDFSRAVGFVTEKMNDEQSKLTASQVALAAFRKAHPFPAVGDQEANELTMDLSRVRGQLQDAEALADDAQKKYLASVAVKKAAPTTINSPTKVVNYDRIAVAKQRLNDLREKLADARSTMSEDNPQVVSYKNQVAIEADYLHTLPPVENNQLIERNPNLLQYDENEASAKAVFDGAEAQVVKDQALVQKETDQLKDFSIAQPEEQKLLTDIALQTASVEDLSKELDLIRVRTTAASDPVHVLAVSQTKPVQPDPLRYTLIAVLVGVAAGVLAALAKDKYDDRVFSMEQIYSISGVPPIGQLPSSKKTLALTAGSGRNALLENYRALRFSLDTFAEGGEPIKSVMVVSPSGLERRQDLTYNLAVEAATDQRATILVDADMRNPKLHEQLGLRLAPGLSDVLRGTVTLEEALQTTTNSKLRLLSAGSPVDDPIELLTSPAMIALHEELKTHAEVIVVNSASLLRHADARAMAKVVDSVLFVARSGATKLAALRYCVELLRRAKAPLLGIVLSESGGYSDVPYYGRD